LTGLVHNDGMRLVAVACLMGLIGWIYQKLPDDLELPTQGTRTESRRFFRFFRGESALQALAQVLDPAVVGNKAATLSQLKNWGYPVPMGYILRAGDDPAALFSLCQPSPQQPQEVRSSAVGEDGLGASAAGQYVSVTDVVSQDGLASAIATCFQAYNRPSAVRYRQDLGLPEASMNVLVQQQIQGVISGVAFSRDPITRCGLDVVIEALPGPASQVVSGQVTPQRYHVAITPEDMPPGGDWQLSDAVDLSMEPNGNPSNPGHGSPGVETFHGTSLPEGQLISPRLIQQIAYLTRHLEQQFGDIPQDVEWTYDGQQIWVLQSRPITTLIPLWTRKIAAEVIPGVIHPLTWSINQPLTCGVWGDLFTLVLGKRAAGLDFSQTAMLHRSYAYFNATLLGDIFIRMGLPAESLEFLTRGAKFSRPPIASTLRNVPGLLKLASREWTLEKDFKQDYQTHFEPGLDALKPPARLSSKEIAHQVERIFSLLKRATFYNILGPLSFALRKAILKVDSDQLNYRSNPEIAAVETIKNLAQRYGYLVQQLETPSADAPADGEELVQALAQLPESAPLFEQFDLFLSKYGYLSELATDISVPTWQEQPAPVRSLLATFLKQPPANKESSNTVSQTGWKQRQVQARLDLKGHIAEVYNRLLAELRACFLALEVHHLQHQSLQQPGDIFFLTWPEIKAWGTSSELAVYDKNTPSPLEQIAIRRQQRQADHDWVPPYLVYGKDPITLSTAPRTPQQTGRLLTGIGASPGTLEGEVQVLTTLDTSVPINQNTILVVPYTDAGWAPLLANLGGLIAEVGGQLSHGAIVAREYGIPAVMDVADVTQRLQTGQRVRIEGQQGTVEILKKLGSLKLQPRDTSSMFPG
ncbi:MAG: PEP/pyruvate-binding domain-containing protein, partial [Leptolyngbyaceae cyanobacterium]